MADEQIKRRGVHRAWLAPLLIVVLFGLAGCGSGGSEAGAGGASEQPADPDTQKVTISDRSFMLELALDADARELGLSDRKEIADDGGMLFVFSQPRRLGFVMRRCYVPIDIVYLDEDGYIDSMHEMQVIEPIGGSQWHNPSKRYWSAGQATFAIELKGGTLGTLGLKRGDRIDLPYEELQSRAQ